MDYPVIISPSLIFKNSQGRKVKQLLCFPIVYLFSLKSILLKTNRKHLFTALITLGFAGNSWAEACYPDTGQPYTFTADFGNFNITDSSKDQAGTVFNNAWSWNLGSKFYATCYCPSGQTYHYNYYTTATALPFGHTDGSETFYKINDYLEVASQVWIGGKAQAYFNVPLDNVQIVVASGGNDACHKPGTIQWGDGGKGKLSFYIRKAFIGTSLISNVEVFKLYINTVSGQAVEPATSRVIVNATISVPQSCTLNLGEIVTVDFGDIVAGKFKNLGQKPDGFTPKTIQAPVTCNGSVNSMANLTVRFQATPDPAYGDAIQSDNPDVGVVVADTSGIVITPNSGLIPFQLSNSQATVSFQTYPVSTTGKMPTEGRFTALAYIRVDFA
jgi:type 1 fimbria pilin